VRGSPSPEFVAPMARFTPGHFALPALPSCSNQNMDKAERERCARRRSRARCAIYMRKGEAE